MEKFKNSIVAVKSYSFALEIIKLNKYLNSVKKDYTISKQVLRAGTSIGANVREALSAESKKDFLHKLGISIKETRETLYWLNLLEDSGYLSEGMFEKLSSACTELDKIITRIIITTKKRYLTPKQTHNS